MSLYRLYSNVLEPSACDKLMHALAQSELMGKSPLNDHFAQSRGFAFTCKKSGLHSLKSQHPEIRPALTQIFSPARQKSFQPWYKRLGGKEPNTFYINILFLPASDGVSAHIDATLARPQEVESLRPDYVSVLYLNGFKPEEGGHLKLLKAHKEFAQIAPQQGTLLRFAGHLKHAISAFRPIEPTSMRASIICEHYCFNRTKLASMPDYKEHRRQPFANYLAAAKKYAAQVEVEYG